MCQIKVKHNKMLRLLMRLLLSEAVNYKNKIGCKKWITNLQS